MCELVTATGASDEIGYDCSSSLLFEATTFLVFMRC